MTDDTNPLDIYPTVPEVPFDWAADTRLARRDWPGIAVAVVIAAMVAYGGVICYEVARVAWQWAVGG